MFSKFIHNGKTRRVSAGLWLREGECIGYFYPLGNGLQLCLFGREPELESQLAFVRISIFFTEVRHETGESFHAVRLHVFNFVGSFANLTLVPLVDLGISKGVFVWDGENSFGCIEIAQFGFSDEVLLCQSRAVGVKLLFQFRNLDEAFSLLLVILFLLFQKLQFLLHALAL